MHLCHFRFLLRYGQLFFIQYLRSVGRALDEISNLAASNLFGYRWWRVHRLWQRRPRRHIPARSPISSARHYWLTRPFLPTGGDILRSFSIHFHYFAEFNDNTHRLNSIVRLTACSDLGRKHRPTCDNRELFSFHHNVRQSRLCRI
jgi:hypothetical protein